MIVLIKVVAGGQVRMNGGKVKREEEGKDRVVSSTGKM